MHTNGVLTASYAYDPNGNRLSRTSPAGTTTGSTHAQERLFQYGNTSYSHTANGDFL